LFFAKGGTDMDLSPDDIKEAIAQVSAQLGERKKVLIVPPDYTRAHSMSGKVSKALYDHYGEAVTDILPALGSHVPVTIAEKDEMFAGIPHDLFRVHDWRSDVDTVGEVPGEFVHALCDQVSEPYPVQVNKLLLEGGHDVIFSVGQAPATQCVGSFSCQSDLFVAGRAARGGRDGQPHQEHPGRDRRQGSDRPEPLPRRCLWDGKGDTKS